MISMLIGLCCLAFFVLMLFAVVALVFKLIKSL